MLKSTNFSIKIVSIFLGFFLSKYIVQILSEGFETFQWIDAFYMFAIFWAWCRFDSLSDDKNNDFFTKFDLEYLGLGLSVPVLQFVLKYNAETPVADGWLKPSIDNLITKINPVLDFMSTYTIAFLVGFFILADIFIGIIES